MRCKLLGAGLVAALLIPAVGAQAQDSDSGYSLGGHAGDGPGRFYITPRFGLSFLTDQDFEAPGLSGEQASFDIGLLGGMSFGYYVMDNLRIELEGTASTNDVDEVEPLPAGVPQGAERLGDVVAYGGFANVGYDFDTGTPFSPFVAAGGGVLRVKTRFDSLTVDDKDTVPAVQARAGVNWNATDSTALGIAYRYQTAVSDPEFDGPAGTVETEFASHAVELSLRYRF